MAGIETRLSASRLSAKTRALVAAGLLGFGAELWLTVGRSNYGTWPQRLAIIITFCTAIIFPLVKIISLQLDRLRDPKPRTRLFISIGIAIFSTAYLYFTAVHQQRPFAMTYVDEFSYEIGAQMAARFHLWMPQHDASDFFEALQLIVKPKYASMYFPGTAILYSPSIWLGLNFWVLPLLAAGACVGLTYRIVAECFDGVAGLLCAIMMLGTSILRLVSIMLLSQTPALLLVLLAIFAWVKSKHSHKNRWLVAVGFFSAWAMLTRPLDAIALLAPIYIAIVVDAVKLKSLWRCLFAVIIGALPWIAIQVVFNLGVTGSILNTPYQLAQARDYPQTSLGFHHFNPAIRPDSLLPQKQQQYAQMTAPAAAAHDWHHFIATFPKWIGKTFGNALPHPLLLVLLPLGALAWDRRRWILLAGAGAWITAYAFYVFNLAHYEATLAPFIAVWIAASIAPLRLAWPRLNHSIHVFLVAAIVILSITETFEFNRQKDQWIFAPELAHIDQQLASIQKPAVVLFTFDPSLSSEVEPVYNSDVASIDDAPIIRAHDLGDRNVEIFRYYAAHQPQRVFYRYDRRSQTLARIDRDAEPAR